VSFRKTFENIYWLEGNNYMDIGLTTILMLSSAVLLIWLLFVKSSPAFAVYALAGVVSLVGLNIHVGITFYLSRIVMIFFIISLLVWTGKGKQLKFPAKWVSIYIIVFSLLLIVQFSSAFFSDHLLDGIRQIFIYISLMTLFLIVIIVGSKVEIIIKAIKIYLVTGLVQGLYGMYQVIGGPLGWPTYQILMAGIPVANDRTVDGYYYSGAYQSFRAIGFFPADVNHFAGYMVGIVLLAIALIVHNRRSLFLNAVLFVGIMALMFSASRSGILALIIFGIPSLSFLLWHVVPVSQRSYWKLTKSLTSVVMIGLMLVTTTIVALKIDLNKHLDSIITRFSDLVNAGGDQYESMSEHILSRLLGLDAWFSSPILGVGPGVNASPWFSEKYNVGWAGSHSHHINILGDSGLMGASFEWLLMCIVVRYMWRGLFVRRENTLERNLLAGLMAAYVTIIFGNLFYSYYLNDFVWFLMACGVALSRAMLVKANKESFIRTPEIIGNLNQSHKCQQT